MSNSNIYSGFRYPPEVITYVVWLYFRLCISFREFEEMLASRRIIVPMKQYLRARNKL